MTKISGVNSSLLSTAYQVHAVQSTCLRHVCLILPLTRAVVSKGNLEIPLGRQWPSSSVECFVAALGLVHSFVVQIACTNLRSRHTMDALYMGLFVYKCVLKITLREFKGQGFAWHLWIRRRGRQFLFSKQGLDYLSVGALGRGREKKKSRLASDVW